MLEQLRIEMRGMGNPERARVSRTYFKTGKGEYGEGDIFLGMNAAQMRKLAREYVALAIEDLERLLASEVHEDRAVALLILVNRFRKADAVRRKRGGALPRPAAGVLPESRRPRAYLVSISTD